MKTKLELIKNYPVESLKNWGDYFGYPEAICEKMTDMVSDVDWANSKIAVLDDFGFQMINFLINTKKVPLQNIYFLVSEVDENKIDLMKKWYSVFVENEVLSVYNINNMSFDLIIANPPYAKNTYIDILEAIKTTNPKQITFLCPWAFTNNVRAGKELKEEIEPFVSSYTQLDGAELFGITLKLLVFHANFEKRTNNRFSTLKPGSIEESIMNKGLSHSDMLKDRVFWIQGLSGNPMPVKINENIEKQLKKGYDGWIFKTVSLARVVQKALIKTEKGIVSGGVGIKTKEDYERLSECIKSKDFCSFVRFVLKVIGDGRDMYSREIPYIPLFTSFEELSLTPEEIERIRNI